MKIVLARQPHYVSSFKTHDKAETELVEQTGLANWTVSRRGWPDFLLEHDGQILCVEVKAKPTTALSKHQRRVLHALASYGVPCYKWTPTGKFVRIEVLPEDRIEARTTPAAAAAVVALLEQLETPTSQAAGGGSNGDMSFEMATARATEEQLLRAVEEKVRAWRARFDAAGPAPVPTTD